MMLAPRVCAVLAVCMVATGAWAQGGAAIPLIPPSPAITTEPLAPPPGGAGQSLTGPSGTMAPGMPAAVTPTPGAPMLSTPAPTIPAPATPSAPTSGTATPGASAPGSPTGTQQGTTAPPGTPQQGAASSAPPADGTYTPAPAVPVTWLPQGTAVLQVLDKVDAQSVTLTVKVGASAQAGPLTIGVRACDISAPNQARDATAFLDITDSHADAPSFHAWMLTSAPSVSMLQNPIYDVRVLGCRP